MASFLDAHFDSGPPFPPHKVLSVAHRCRGRTTRNMKMLIILFCVCKTNVYVDSEQLEDAFACWLY